MSTPASSSMARTSRLPSSTSNVPASSTSIFGTCAPSSSRLPGAPAGGRERPAAGSRDYTSPQRRVDGLNWPFTKGGRFGSPPAFHKGRQALGPLRAVHAQPDLHGQDHHRRPRRQTLEPVPPPTRRTVGGA